MNWYDIRGTKLLDESPLEAAKTYIERIPNLVGKYRLMVYHDHGGLRGEVAGIFDVENKTPTLVTHGLSE